jgi:head-tail adaptor
VRIGDLSKRWLTFQAPHGSPTQWQTMFKCKESNKGLSGVENMQAMALGGTITGTVRIPWRPVLIKTTWRILCENNTLSIVSPAIDTTYPGEGRFWVMKVKQTI